MRLFAAVLLCSAATLAAQAEPAFEVTSLKRNTSLSDMGGGGPRPGGRYRLTNMPARSMIGLAWSIPTDRVEADLKVSLYQRMRTSERTRTSHGRRH